MRHVLTQGKEDDDFTPPPTTPSVAVADKWADEDKEDNIKDSWEDEDTPKEQEKPAETKQQETTKKEKPAKKTAKPASKTKGKGAASASSAKASVDDDWLDDPVAEKRRKQHMVEESDFQVRLFRHR
jgi:translation initiation factor 3 subunit J